MVSRLIDICSAPLVLLLVFANGGAAEGSSYRDKHGNEGTITLDSAIVDTGGSGIDYAVPYVTNDSQGSYVITSEMLPGRDPGSDDFVLNVFVIDDSSQNAAELILRNNPDVAPLMPILRLLDCSSDPCTEDMRYDDPRWGAWVIQDQSDIADYPIELLDARVILELLEPGRLSMLPNSDDGTGNWAEIMENHRTNFEEVKFRADAETLGDDQSDLLTLRMIAELEDKLGIPDPMPGVYIDWLRRHDPAIAHSQLSFLTGHTALIEALTTTLFTDHLDDWPLDFSFPFGRMPVFLIDPHDDAGADSPGAVDPIHQLPMHWERVIVNPADPAGGLNSPGCWHNWPGNAYAPTLGDGTANLGQFECATSVTLNGFVDRRCDVDADYTTVVDPLGADRLDGSGNPRLDPLVGSLRRVQEQDWHNPIHGIIGGTFGPIDLTAGSMVFWTFHTYASTVMLSNWRHAQKRDMGIPEVNSPPTVECPDPVIAECTSFSGAEVILSASVDDPDGDDVTVSWEVDDALVLEELLATPNVSTLTHTYPLGFHTDTVSVDDGLADPVSCETTVTVEDTTPPDVTVTLARAQLWPPSHDLIDVGLATMVTDICDPNAGDSLVVEVWSDETEVPEKKGDGSGNFAPDAKFPGSSLRLRAERRGREDGRVYLIIARATDASGQVGFACSTVTVSHDKSRRGLADIADQAAAATAHCELNGGAPPAAYAQHGLSQEIGPKQ